MRARMALAAAGAEVMLREVLLKDKPAELLAASPKATVPVLVLSDGRVIEESLEVMQWALEYRDPLGWLEGAALDSDWISECDGDFKHWLDRYKYAERYPEHSAEDYRINAEAFIQRLEDQLSGSEWGGWRRSQCHRCGVVSIYSPVCRRRPFLVAAGALPQRQAVAGKLAEQRVVLSNNGQISALGIRSAGGALSARPGPRRSHTNLK